MKIGRDRHTRLERIDIRFHDDHPTLVGWTEDRRAVAYPLSPLETAALIRRLTGYLAAHLRTEQEQADG